MNPIPGGGLNIVCTWRRRPARRQRGVSLLELVIVITLIGILAASSVEPLRQAFRSRQQLSDSLQTLGELRYAGERIARELQQALWQSGAGLSVQPLDAAVASSTGLCFTRIGTNPEGAAVAVVIRVQDARLMFDHQPCDAVPAYPLLPARSAVRFDYFTLNPADGSRTALAVTAADFRFQLRLVDVTVSREVAGGTLSQTTAVLMRNSVWGDGAGGS